MLALDADDAASDVEVVKEAEAVALEVECADFPEEYVDGKDELTLRDAAAEEMLRGRDECLPWKGGEHSPDPPILVPSGEHLIPGACLIASAELG